LGLSRDEHSPQSDIDILVDFNGPIGIEFLDILSLLKEEFDSTPVQVVSKKGIKKKYYDRLKQDLLYA
jgi:predicted nucleotidyltransferase